MHLDAFRQADAESRFECRPSGYAPQEMCRHSVGHAERETTRCAAASQQQRQRANGETVLLPRLLRNGDAVVVCHSDPAEHPLPAPAS
jgi:hypothetical protein